MLLQLLQTVNYQHDPSTVTSDREEGSSLEMTVRFTISNNFSNFSLCILIRFPGEHSATVTVISLHVHVYIIDLVVICVHSFFFFASCSN